MSFAFAAVALCVVGLALLHLLRLATRRTAVDLPLAWLVGSAWFALAAAASRFAVGVPFSWPLAAAILAGPPAAWAALRTRRGPSSAPPADSPQRWVPRPAPVWLPIAAYVVLVLAAVVLHGANTPTNTDDGVRVRAFTPMLAWSDVWGDRERELLVEAGPLPTFVPAVAWVFTGTVDHFHVNYVVLTDLVALVALAVALGSSRGSPERGWASAFAVLSIPLFVYHCTTTYQDAVLAIFLAAALMLVMEYGRARDPGDAGRALLLLVAAAMVKREGEIVAASAAAVLVAQLGWERARGANIALRRLALLAAIPATLVLATKVAAVGSAEAFPLLKLFAKRLEGVPLTGEGSPSPQVRQAAVNTFVYALFRSGNAGGIHWALTAAVLLRARALLRPWFGWSLAIVTLVLAETAVSSMWLIPEFTVNETTVHRALLAPTVLAAIWLAAFLVDGAYQAEEHEEAVRTEPREQRRRQRRSRQGRRRSAAASAPVGSR